MFAADVARLRNAGTYREAFAQAIVDSNAWSCLSDSDKERWLKGATDAFAGSMAEQQSRKDGCDAAHADGVEDNSFFRSFGARYIWNGPWPADSMVLRDSPGL